MKKYLLKGIDLENADSKGLKTLALCWIFRKRAFSVSGQFRKALTDLITYLHNSNKKLVQTTLSGDKLLEEKFHLLCFVPSRIIGSPNVWYCLLNLEQINKLAQFLNERTKGF